MADLNDPCWPTEEQTDLLYNASYENCSPANNRECNNLLYNDEMMTCWLLADLVNNEMTPWELPDPPVMGNWQATRMGNNRISCWHVMTLYRYNDLLICNDFTYITTLQELLRVKRLWGYRVKSAIIQ